MVAVDDPDPPQEATIETESMGVLRAHTVVVQRLANELFHIEELHLRVQQGCELDAAQREKLGREDELLAALEAAVAVAEAAFAVPRTGPGSPQKREVQSALDAQRPQQIEPESPQQPRATLGPTRQHEEPCSDLVQQLEELSALVQRPHQPRVAKTQAGPRSPLQREQQAAHEQRPQQPRVEKTHKTGPGSQREHKESVPLVQRPQQSSVAKTQIGPKSPRKRKEQSALVQRPQQPEFGPVSQRKREEQSALVQRPQQPRVAETQLKPVSLCEHEEQSALVQRPQQPRVAETQLKPVSLCEHEEQSALVQRPQQPRVAETQLGPESPREHKEQSALVQRPQQLRATVEVQPEPQSEPEPRDPKQQSEPEPQKPEPQSDAEPDNWIWKPGGFEPRVFDPGGSTEMTVRKPAHNTCSSLRVRLRLRGDG